MSKQKRASLSPPKLSAAVRVLQPAAGEVFKDHYVFEIFHGDTLLNEWELMREPNPAHKPSFDTGIPVCILVLKRCKKDDDVLFINAAEHFVKGKRQNQLNQEHIDKIIATYQQRQAEPRYSRRVEMAEIEKNDFNLNISRYISTAVAEAEIDLGAIHGELLSLEQSIREARDQHNGFLQELGLHLLP
jgi:hypothetical protein